VPTASCHLICQSLIDQAAFKAGLSVPTFELFRLESVHAETPPLYGESWNDEDGENWRPTTSLVNTSDADIGREDI